MDKLNIEMRFALAKLLGMGDQLIQIRAQPPESNDRAPRDLWVIDGDHSPAIAPERDYPI